MLEGHANGVMAPHGTRKEGRSKGGPEGGKGCTKHGQGCTKTRSKNRIFQIEQCSNHRQLLDIHLLLRKRLCYIIIIVTRASFAFHLLLNRALECFQGGGSSTAAPTATTASPAATTAAPTGDILMYSRNQLIKPSLFTSTLLGIHSRRSLANVTATLASNHYQY